MGRNGRAADPRARRAKALADQSADGRSLSGPRGSPDGHSAEAIRARVVDALVALVAEHGYARTSVSRILELARVPSSAFYELFSDRHECFLAAFDAELERIWTHVQGACDGGGSWRERTRRGLTALLELFEQEPHLARLFVIDSLEAGDRVLGRRNLLLAELVAVLGAGRLQAGDGLGVTPSAEEVVQAALSVLEARIREAGTEGLVEFANPLMALLVLPFHGLPASAQELTVPLPARERGKRSSQAVYREPDLSLSPRSLMLLRAVGEAPDASNRMLARRTGIADEGQISRMLARLEQLDLVCNDSASRTGTNAWTLSAKGAQLLSIQSRPDEDGSP